MKKTFLEPTQKAGATLFSRKITGEVVMLNLLRFRDIADYSANPELAPHETISGHEAFQKYIDHTNPLLQKSGGEYLEGIGHRTAALEDSRLLPIVPSSAKPTA